MLAVVLMLAGLTAVVVGVCLIWVPAGVIAGGVAATVVGFDLARPTRPPTVAGGDG